MLSDRNIRIALRSDRIIINPFNEDNLQPASYDLTLDSHFLMPSRNERRIDLKNVKVGHMIPYQIDPLEGLILSPGEFILGSTREVITLSNGYVGRIEGKSSLGRLGLLVHVTAGFIDPGFSGQVTLEMFNAAPWELVLYPDQLIAQLAFSRLDNVPRKIYGGSSSHYQGQVGPVESRFGM